MRSSGFPSKNAQLCANGDQKNCHYVSLKNEAKVNVKFFKMPLYVSFLYKFFGFKNPANDGELMGKYTIGF